MSEDRNRDLAEIISYNESERIEHVVRGTCIDMQKVKGQIGLKVPSMMWYLI